MLVGSLLGYQNECIAQQSIIKNYILDHKILAGILSETYGIPSSVILSVAIVESSAGESEVAHVLNNHFGMAGKNDYVNRNGNKSRYKQYDNEIESYIDFCIYISNRKFYDKLKDKKDSRMWVKAISRCGYSEEPEAWEQKVMHTILVNKLK